MSRSSMTFALNACLVLYNLNLFFIFIILNLTFLINIIVFAEHFYGVISANTIIFRDVVFV